MTVCNKQLLWLWVLVWVLAACSGSNIYRPTIVAVLPTSVMVARDTLTYDTPVSDTLPPSTIHQWHFTANGGEQLRIVFVPANWFGLLEVVGPHGVITDGRVYNVELNAVGGIYTVTVGERYGAGHYQIGVYWLNPTTPTPTPPPTGSVTLGTGDVQITLRWYTRADLDLYVTDPNGEEIYYRHRLIASGGRLDVDANFPCNTGSTTPVENVFWPPGASPLGTYTVRVNYFSTCDLAAASDYEVTITIVGRAPQTFAGTLQEQGDWADVTTFTR